MCGSLAHSFARTTYQARSIPRSLVSPDPLVRQLSRSARLVRSFVCSLERAYGTTNHISTDVVKWRITPLAYSSWISPIPLARLLVHHAWPNRSLDRSLPCPLASLLARAWLLVRLLARSFVPGCQVRSRAGPPRSFENEREKPFMSSHSHAEIHF